MFSLLTLAFTFVPFSYLDIAALSRRRLVISATSSPGRDLSLNQRWRSFKFNMGEKKARVLQLPPFAALVALAAAARRMVQPLYDLYAASQQKRLEISEIYNQFLAEETKKRWTWSKKNKKELALLQAVPPFVFGECISREK